MKIIQTFVVNWNDDGYSSLCKVYLLEDGTYVWEHDTGKKTVLKSVTKDEFIKQSSNPLF